MNFTPKTIQHRQPLVEDALPGELSPLIRRIFLHRGVGNAQEMRLDLDALLSFHKLKGIEASASLLAEAIEKNWHLLIVGDFDADGATSTALAMTALTRMGGSRVSYLVPDRFRYGYGLTPEIVELALESSPDLIITVDNGISSIEGVSRARAAGVRVLVTDHHLPGESLPDADVIVNPNQPGCEFPSKNLAGVGVIFYVMLALRAELRKRGLLQNAPGMSDLLDLVALGTVADLVPLDHNNRILVQQGLHRIRHGRARPGIQALCTVAGRDYQRLLAMDLGFFIGPRLNAAGRLEDMSIGIECLLTADTLVAANTAQRLHELNAQRRELQAQMQEEAEALVVNSVKIDDLPNSICLFDAEWHEGIVGLVASKVKEKYHRPTIAFAPSGKDGVLKGSARSVPGLHIRDVLDSVAAGNPGILSKFGGHAMAAGLSLEASNLMEFKRVFEQAVTSHLGEMGLEALIYSDGELAESELNLSTAEELEQAAPWGQRFPEPVFHGQFEILEHRVVGQNHLKMRVKPDKGVNAIDAIGFNLAEQVIEQTSDVKLVYRLGVNEYMGKRNPQLVVEYMEFENKSPIEPAM